MALGNQDSITMRAKLPVKQTVTSAVEISVTLIGTVVAWFVQFSDRLLGFVAFEKHLKKIKTWLIFKDHLAVIFTNYGECQFEKFH